jgi:hypothetical protein
MSTTSDPQAEYGEKPKREPFMRTEILSAFMNYGRVGGLCVSNWYEDKIASGELIVAKTVGIDKDGNCTGCGWDADHRYPFSICCPGCGARIESSTT